MNIQWYPGHMTKTRRQIEADLKNVDIVVEIIDARSSLFDSAQGSKNFRQNFVYRSIGLHGVYCIRTD